MQRQPLILTKTYHQTGISQSKALTVIKYCPHEQTQRPRVNSNLKVYLDQQNWRDKWKGRWKRHRKNSHLLTIKCIEKRVLEREEDETVWEIGGLLSRGSNIQLQIIHGRGNSWRNQFWVLQRQRHFSYKTDLVFGIFYLQKEGKTIINKNLDSIRFLLRIVLLFYRNIKSMKAFLLALIRQAILICRGKFL